jgi:hypothetical protein
MALFTNHPHQFAGGCVGSLLANLSVRALRDKGKQCLLTRFARFKIGEKRPASYNHIAKYIFEQKTWSREDNVQEARHQGASFE